MAIRSVAVVFPFCVGTWGCYLCSHYLVEGEFIDESRPEREDGEAASLADRLPPSPTRWILAVGGYIVGHQGITGKPL